jgi:hypothetical protein
LSSESRRSELNPIRSASVSVRIVGSALHTTHSHHLSKSGLRSAGAAFADSPQVYPPLAARSRDKARSANEFALVPTQSPQLGGEPDRSTEACGVSPVGRTEIRRVFAAQPPTPATPPHWFGPTRSYDPASTRERILASAPIFLRGSRIPSVVGLGDRNSNRAPRLTQ